VDRDDEMISSFEPAEPLEHVGLEPQRVVFPSGDLERIFAFNWMERNSEQWCLLDKLLSTNDHPGGASQWDAIVAATIIQWLGTNIGFRFLVNCLKEAGYQVKETPR
jgi:hypothetical protein